VTRISAGWSCLLAAFLVSIPIVSASAVGDGGSQRYFSRHDVSEAATGLSAPARFTSVAVPTTPAQIRHLAAVPAPPPAPTFAPPAAPQQINQPPPPADPGVCPDALSVNVLNPELIGAVQGGIDLLREHFGCRKFRIDGTGVTIRFGDISPRFNAKVLGYADNTSANYEIWLNPDCWGVVQGWEPVVAHELGHYLGWQHGHDQPYMWLAPPPGSYARPGDLMIVCY
jgi:hypothetical protein